MKMSFDEFIMYLDYAYVNYKIVIGVQVFHNNIESYKRDNNLPQKFYGFNKYANEIKEFVKSQLVLTNLLKGLVFFNQ